MSKISEGANKSILDLRDSVVLVQRKDAPWLFGVSVPGYAITPLPEGYDGQTIIRIADSLMVATRKGLPPLRVQFFTGEVFPLEVNDRLKSFHVEGSNAIN